MDEVQGTQLYRVNEVCDRLAISRSAMYREFEAGNLHPVRRGKSVRVSSVELARYVAALTALAS
jgi:hypothetical protein